jgi:probable F420-dependent oxidoreductase
MGVAIGLGLGDFPFDDISGFWRWVDACEDSWVDSLWQSDRLIADTPMLECMSLMAALAGRTRRMRFGMNVAAIGWRDPLVLAKACATIDRLGGGRLLPAFGIGSPNAAEWAALGLDPRVRGRRTDEALELISRLWRGETVDFDGRHFSWTGVRIDPLPVQRPLPLWLGGSSEAAIRRTARFGTGWIAGFQAPGQVAPVVAAIRAAGIAAGRPIPEDHYGAGFYFRFGSWDDPGVRGRAAAFAARTRRVPEDCFVVGDAAEMLARLRAFIGIGVTKFVLQPAAAGNDDILDQTRRLMAEVLPHVPALSAEADALEAARAAAGATA